MMSEIKFKFLQGQQLSIQYSIDNITIFHQKPCLCPFPSPPKQRDGQVKRFSPSPPPLPPVPVGMIKIMINQDNFPVRSRAPLKDVFSPLSVP